MPFPAHLNDAAIEEIRPRARRHPRRGDGQPRRARPPLHPPADPDPAQLALGGRVIDLRQPVLLPRWEHALRGMARVPRASSRSARSMLGLAKILENMEIGHNVMHAQWDWMRDPGHPVGHLGVGQRLPVRPVEALAQRRASHVDERARQGPRRRLRHPARDRRSSGGTRSTSLQPFSALLMALLFEWFIALHDVEINRVLAGKTAPRAGAADAARHPSQGRAPGAEGLRAVAAPRAAPSSLYVLRARTPTANVIRNLWTYVIIFCGHFPAGVHFFTKEEVEGETRARWYVRQLLGSCNIEGGPLFHVLVRQPEPPDRAPPVPGHAEQPLPRGRAARARAVRALRPAVQHGLARPAVRDDAGEHRAAGAAGACARGGFRSARIEVDESFDDDRARAIDRRRCLFGFHRRDRHTIAPFAIERDASACSRVRRGASDDAGAERLRGDSARRRAPSRRISRRSDPSPRRRSGGPAGRSRDSTRPSTTRRTIARSMSSKPWRRRTSRARRSAVASGRRQAENDLCDAVAQDMREAFAFFDDGTFDGAEPTGSWS